MLVRPRMVTGAAILSSLFLLDMNGSRAASPVPANLETPQALQAGAHLFRENCIPCHGAPGVAPAVQGLTPAPPNLLAASRRNDPTEVFSKVKNGIAGTAMPAFGKSLSDQDVWSLAAFLHMSRGISPDAFNALSTPKADASHEKIGGS